jgi:hypothetical protein
MYYIRNELGITYVMRCNVKLQRSRVTYTVQTFTNLSRTISPFHHQMTCHRDLKPESPSMHCRMLVNKND